MATDGADFQKRKNTQGKFFAALKDGADADRLAVLAVEAIEKGLRLDAAPAFAKALSILLQHFEPGELFSTDPDRLKSACQALKQVDSALADWASTRSVVEAARKTAAQIERGHCDDPAAGLFQNFAEQELFAHAQTYGEKHRGKQSMHILGLGISSAAREMGSKLVAAVAASGDGKPPRGWRHASGGDHLSAKPQPVSVHEVLA